MTAGLKLRQIGNSVGLVIPKEELAKFKLGVDDTLYLTNTPDGFHLTPYEPEFERQMEIARKVMKKHRNVLRELAK